MIREAGRERKGREERGGGRRGGGRQELWPMRRVQFMTRALKHRWLQKSSHFLGGCQSLASSNALGNLQ